jgi:hypothetical protein
MSADKIIKALFAVLEQEVDKGTGTSAAIAASVVKQLGKTLASEMNSNQEFHDRIAQIIDPNFMPSPVAIVQRSGPQALSDKLGKMALAQVKKIGTGSNLMTAADVTGQTKAAVIALLVTRAQKEAGSQKKFG